MGKELYLFIADAVVLAGLCGYLVFLAKRQASVATRLARLEGLRER